ncbi:MAG TPA: relaxase/mobilization nuclease domain-containing protein [Stenomitos sp.]
MRIKVVKGNDPTGLCQYLLDPAKQIEEKENPILYSNMSGRTGEELAEEFRFAKTLNRRVETSMCHYCVSMPPGEQIGRNHITAISKGLLQKMGHEKCQYFIVQHHDREHRNGVQHWHIATSAIALDGQWVNDGFNRNRLRQVEQQLEREFGLQETVIRSVRDRHNLTTGEYRLKERSGKILPKEMLWQKIQSAAQGQQTFPQFVERLQRSGVTVKLNRMDGLDGLQGEGIKGISYGINGVAFAGAKLGPAYSLRGIQQHLGVNYDPARDDAALGQLMSHPAAFDAPHAIQRIGTTLEQIRQRRLRQQQQTGTTLKLVEPDQSSTEQSSIEQSPMEPDAAQQQPHKPKKPDLDLEL